MAVKALIPVLVAMMLLTGVCNTLLTKSDPKERKTFEQPVIQTAQMFIGEMGCWIFVGLFSVYTRWTSHRLAPEENGYQPVNAVDGELLDNDAASLRSTTPINPAVNVMAVTDVDRLPLTGWRVCLLSLPATCDICGTTLMNVGLFFVTPSIYQMTRGALVLFVGLFSVVFLKRRLYLFQWFALVTVVLGVALVGLAGAIYKDHKAAPAGLLLIREAVALATRAARTPEAVRAIIGVTLIASAQIFTASQFVLEEYILEKYALKPLKVVGWEGLFGFGVTVLGMIILHLAIGRTSAGRYGYFDLVEGWREITHYKSIGVSSILIMISIGGFNFFGLEVTRTVSATSRSTIDTCRTLFIWIASLLLGWESFKWLQVLGFGLLIYGTFLFNNLIQPPLKSSADGHYLVIMTEVETPRELFDPDDVMVSNSPMLKAMRPNLSPSPTPPPAVPLPEVSPEPPNRFKHRPSQGDAVLLSFMYDGKQPELAHQGGLRPLASEDEGAEHAKEAEATAGEEGARGIENEKETNGRLKLAALAANALRRAHEEQVVQPASTMASIVPMINIDGRGGEGDSINGVKPTIPSITATLLSEDRSHPSLEASGKIPSNASPLGELPPIQPSNGGQVVLPSISDHLGDLKSPRFAPIQPPQTSPPKSPGDTFRRDLPSPGRGAGHYYYGANNNPRRPSQTDGAQYASAGEYSSTETPSTDQSGSTPATAIDRMSIDGITHPQIGNYVCTYPNCTAQPFQTQYLLNSHANVHSSNRPHYCTVKGCPRSEGGKGFKRKNEMIRHGLVHDSPGYVCPFCPDREHKYPRPDNLQRHVRVHHVDRDKDDPQLREVLSQRPEGPSRGRRRRGGTT
ncbi:hypothetical protein B7494_g7290 [Chlorociboria aeruginascens]|nr:hypothetical protein B7494_g7290 [Chlorociboria aeruginascens]